MKTIQEVMEKYHLTRKEYALSEGGSYYTVENIEAAMAEYADQFKVKNLAQPDVSGNEALRVAVCPHCKAELYQGVMWNWCDKCEKVLGQTDR